MQEAREWEWIEFDAWIGKEIDRIRVAARKGSLLGPERPVEPDLGRKLLRVTDAARELAHILVVVRDNPDMLDHFLTAILRGTPTIRERSIEDFHPTREWGFDAARIVGDRWNRTIRSHYALMSANAPWAKP